jgi:hypothetical protein
MEDFFTSCRRLDYCYGVESIGYTERQLAVPIQAFLDHQWDWSDFRAFAATGGMWKILWIAEDTFIAVEGPNAERGFNRLTQLCSMQRATFTVPCGETHNLVLAHLSYNKSLGARAFPIFWRVVATSNCVKLKLENTRREFGLCSDPALSHFLEASTSLRRLGFEGFYFEKAGCLALVTLKRKDLKVTFHRCYFVTEGAEETFIEWLRHGKVVTELEHCSMDDGTISALNGNSSVKSLTVLSSCRGKEATIRTLAHALSGNQGIENLEVLLTEKTSSLLLHSLWAHPRIQSVRLHFTNGLSATVKTSMMQAILQLVQCNTLVHTIVALPYDRATDEFFHCLIVPRLEMNFNCFGHQRQALKRADPSIRGQLLGRALHVVRYNPDLLFRFLSENVPAFVRSD